MIFNLNRRKGESQGWRKFVGYGLWLGGFLSCFLLTITYNLKPALAIVDPLASPNNKFGIHIITASPDEASPAASLVNSSGGNWGYITVLIEGKDKDQNKWQTFFNDLRRRHLIPLVRIATQPDGENWKVPPVDEEQVWADFLDSLVWPVKNRYIIIYNEPNHGKEWGGGTDPISYAQVLDKTITALKNKSPDFFVLNAGMDGSAPNQPPYFYDEAAFLRGMKRAVPGIFDKLDGWVSHSYPNPGFVGSPTAFGRGTVGNWSWELRVLRELGVTKDLPVFITETGWKHAEGVYYDKSLPSAEEVGNLFKIAFDGAWNSSEIVAVTPFLLNYQEPPFDHFSFKKLTGEPQNSKILGASYPEYYPSFQALLDYPKSKGQPVQENLTKLVSGTIYPSIVAGESYSLNLTVENKGQSIWNDEERVQLRVLEGQKELGIVVTPTSLDKVEPGQKMTFKIDLQAPSSGGFPVSLQLFHNDKPFDSPPFKFTTEVKSPVILMIQSALAYKKSFGGEYLLSIASDVINGTIRVSLDDNGRSAPLETRALLPDHQFQFTLSKPFYKPKAVSAEVKSGVNNLDFGTLYPDFLSALFKPRELWKLLPFSK